MHTSVMDGGRRGRSRRSQYGLRPRWRPVTCHLAIDDASGDSAIFEFLNGQLSIWHDRAYKVMTNSPPYGEQLKRLKALQDLDDDSPLPGSTESTAPNLLCRQVGGHYDSARLRCHKLEDRADEY